jgi:hypothetical protein
VDPFLEHLKEFIHGFERMAQGEAARGGLGWKAHGVEMKPDA